MAAWVGMIFGGCVVVFLLSMLLEWAIFKRVTDSWRVGIPLSVIAAVVLATGIYGFAKAHGGDTWDPLPGGLAYIIGGAIVFAFRMWERGKHVERDELGDTFR